MRILGVMPVRNEAERWLDASLSWQKNFLDDIFVYDDRSTDRTLRIALKHTPHVRIRSEEEPSFMDHEGKFRQNCWNHMEEELQPEDGDWILAFDADEFAIGGFDHSIRDRLEMLAESAEATQKNCCMIDIPEIWNHTDKLYARVDGFWKNKSPRFVKWLPNGTFRNKKMGCGSTPEQNNKPLTTIHAVSVLHFGYSLEKDRMERYERYTSMRNHGHNPKHINSILEKPTLIERHGPAPKIWLGEK